MTLQKYKKLLMSYGIDRDQAEEDRKTLARWRRLAVRDGVDPHLDILKTLSLEEVVSRRKEWGTTSRRGCIKYLKKLMKNIVVV